MQNMFYILYLVQTIVFSSCVYLHSYNNINIGSTLGKTNLRYFISKYFILLSFLCGWIPNLFLPDMEQLGQIRNGEKWVVHNKDILWAEDMIFETDIVGCTPFSHTKKSFVKQISKPFPPHLIPSLGLKLRKSNLITLKYYRIRQKLQM